MLRRFQLVLRRLQVGVLLDGAIDPCLRVLLGGQFRAEVVRQSLQAADRLAGDLGVTGVPSFRIGDEVFWGDDRLDQAISN